MRCESQRQCDTARRLRLLPVPGHVDDPVPAGRLLLVMTLVLAGGIGAIDHRSANAAIIDIVIAPRPCSSLAVKRSDFGSTMVDPVALMAHVHHVRDPDLAVVGLPVALLGDPLLLGLGGGRTGRGFGDSARPSRRRLGSTVVVEYESGGGDDAFEVGTAPAGSSQLERLIAAVRSEADALAGAGGWAAVRVGFGDAETIDCETGRTVYVAG